MRAYHYLILYIWSDRCFKFGIISTVVTLIFVFAEDQLMNFSPEEIWGFFKASFWLASFLNVVWIFSKYLI